MVISAEWLERFCEGYLAKYFVEQKVLFEFAENAGNLFFSKKKKAEGKEFVYLVALKVIHSKILA